MNNDFEIGAIRKHQPEGIIEDPHDLDTKDFIDDEKEVAIGSEVKIAEIDGEVIASEDILDNGKERPIESAHDIATRLISLEDDPTQPVYTLRFWFLGLGLTCFSSVLGQIYYFRPQTVYVSPLFLQVISFALGRMMDQFLPGEKYLGKFGKFVNPGPFNIKEHVGILIMTSTGTSSALAISVFAADELYYNIDANWGVAIFTLLSSQLMGYGLAGLARSFTVYPTYIIQPSLIPKTQLFDALHRQKDSGVMKKRLRFFWIVFTIIFVWEWIPEFIAPTLTGFSIFCLASRKNPWFTYIFGGSNGNEGMGILSFCFDWYYVGSSSLYTPWFTQVNSFLGIIMCYLITLLCFKGNVWKAQNFPFLSQDLFYENGTVYDQTLILNPDYSLNETALAIQGVPWYAMSNAMYYLGNSMAIGAQFTHVAIWYGPSIWKSIKEWRSNTQTDPHYQKMLVYPEVPMWWYGATLIVSFACAMATAYTGHSQMPWWALIIAILLSSFAFPFVTVIGGITGFSLDVSGLAQMLGSGVLPGNSQANLWFTLWGGNVCLQASALAVDLKLGQYVKLPPRATFWAQSVGTVVGAILQIIIMKSIISAQREILLSIQGTNIWSGQSVQSYNSQAVAWGALAKHMYGPSSPYFIVPMSTIIGIFLPIPFWIIHQFRPNWKADKVLIPGIVWYIGYLSVGINSGVFTSVLLGIFSQFYLRRKRATWFRKYNYLLSAGLDGGTQFMSFIATFAVFGGSGKSVSFPTWALNPELTYVNYDYCLNTNQ